LVGVWIINGEAVVTTHYRCPLCQQPLQANPSGLACTKGHQFDRAKEGYVNLLPVQHKGSKTPGDAQSMVMARRQFLSAGHYQFLRQGLVDIMVNLDPTPVRCIDAGCGEGYYTNEIAQQLQPSQSTVYGIDIAKPAIRYAAKRAGNNSLFAVASTANLPFESASVDLVYKIFAPIELAEVSRVLKPQGILISVVPGPRHLFELKQLIYPYPKEHQSESTPLGYENLLSKSLSQKVTLSTTSDIDNLTQMTPFAWKLNDSKHQQLLDTSDFTVNFDFVINLYAKQTAKTR
jgi:23S rRNA (guanine745-N1)-methyltransferase